MCFPPWEWMPPTLNMRFPCGNTCSHVWGNSMFTRLGTYGVFMWTNTMLFNMGTCVAMRRHIFPCGNICAYDGNVIFMCEHLTPMHSQLSHSCHIGTMHYDKKVFCNWPCNTLFIILHYECYQTSCMNCKCWNSPYIQCNSIAILLKQLIFNYYAIALQLQP
jgi:hypothetical protein